MEAVVLTSPSFNLPPLLLVLQIQYRDGVQPSTGPLKKEGIAPAAVPQNKYLTNSSMAVDPFGTSAKRLQEQPIAAPSPKKPKKGVHYIDSDEEDDRLLVANSAS